MCVCAYMPVCVFQVSTGRWEKEPRFRNKFAGNMLSKYGLLYWFTYTTVYNCERGYSHDGVASQNLFMKVGPEKCRMC